MFEQLQYQDYVVKLYTGAGFRPKTVKTREAGKTKQLTIQRGTYFHIEEGATLKTPLAYNHSLKWHTQP